MREVGSVAPGHVQARAERHDHPLRLTGKTRGDVGELRAGDFPGAQAGRTDDVVAAALDQHPAVGDVGDLVAALGLVHVVRADEHA